MNSARVSTSCECQASLFAEVDENLNVIGGVCEDSRKRQIRAPAAKVLSSNGQLGITFSCPVCTRNVLRTFSLAGIAFDVSAANSSAVAKSPT